MNYPEHKRNKHSSQKSFKYVYFFYSVMKKRAAAITLSLFLFFLLVISFVSAESIFSIIGRIIEGYATSGNHAVSITVGVNAPTLEILLPLNQTYLKTTDIPLNFTSDGDDFWYSLDYGTNTSITENTTFKVSAEGTHEIYLYANNTANIEAGITNRTIVFDVNLTRINLSYSEFNETFKGDSVDFCFKYTFEQLGNITDIIFENTNYGKIIFSDIINLTDDDNYSDYNVDIDSNVNISYNRIEINVTSLPNFNKSAEIYLYNLTFTDPQILRNDEICPASICTEISYSRSTGTLVFDVTSFTIYTVRETPSGGAGGTPGGATPSKPAAGSGGFGILGGGEEETKEIEITPGLRVPAPVRPLFDVEVFIPKKYQVLIPGEDLIVQTTILNVKAPQPVDIIIEYYIRDSEGTEIWNEFETKAIERKLTSLKTVRLSDTIELGNYLFYAVVRYENTTSTGGALFSIVKEKVTEEEKLVIVAIIVGIILVFVILLAIYYYERQRREMKVITRRLNAADLYRVGLIKSKKRR